MAITNTPAARGASPGDAAIIAELDRVFATQSDAYRTTPAPTLAQRRQQLRAIERILLEHRDAFAAVSQADFGSRAATETEISEIVVSLASVRYMRRHLRRWMKPRRRSTSIWFKPGVSRIVPQPKGVVGVMVPWNFPIHLAIVPIATALAAGNRVMVKASEYTPATAELLSRLFAEEFDSDTVFITAGEREVSEAFSRIPFAHLLFTGSTGVGRAVARAAAENLTPVTLELGGKSPVVVTPGYSLERAAKSVAWGRLLNGGQICVAPDYVLVPGGQEAEFASAVQRAALEMYPTIAGNPEYTSAIHPGEFTRLQAMLGEIDGQPVVSAADPDVAVDERKLPLQVVINPAPDSLVATKEIFGPILPVFGYRDLDDAIAQVNERERPLALYVFSDKRADREAVLTRTTSGGVTVNDTLLHYLINDLPFGGVGASGMGAYHGREGFDTFSHLKPVFYQRWLAGRTGAQLLYPPYGRVAELLLGLMRKF